VNHDPSFYCLDIGANDPAVIHYGLGAAALRYQGMGCAVLGLAESEKRPHPAYGGEGGVYWATTDHQVVPWLWGRYPVAGVGIATGWRSRLVVVDLDVKHGENGIANFAAFMTGEEWGHRVWAIQQAFPGAPVVSTPSGGFHIYLRTPPGWQVPMRNGMLPGVDIKGDGGYVVAPPTRVWVDDLDGSRVRLPYRQITGTGCPCSPPDAPPWFLDWISRGTATGTDHGYGGTGDPLPDLDQLKRDGLPRGERNVILHRVACSLYRRCGTTPQGMAAVRSEIDQVLAATDTSGFPRSEVERILLSARSFVTRSSEAERAGYDDYWNR
jgi:hypothetical protein